MSQQNADLYRIQVESIEGKVYSFKDYMGKVVLVVNTASKCGYTPQYKGLEELYSNYKDKGLVVLGMPCNQFGKQEPGSEEEIKDFCEVRYGVTFPLLKKGDVKGDSQHPLYAQLLKQAKEKGDVKWNFEKFLIHKDGTVSNRFGSGTKPNDRKLIDAIEAAL